MIPSPQNLRDWFIIFNSIYVDESLAQGGAFVRFMVCQLIKIPEDVVELHLFEVFHLDQNLPIIMVQAHVFGSLPLIESMGKDSRVPYDSQIRN